jgi:hypothetical protein
MSSNTTRKISWKAVSKKKSGAPYTNGESSIVSYDALSGEEINHLMHGLHPHCTIDGEAVFDQASEKNTISLVENTLTRGMKYYGFRYLKNQM